MGVSIVILCAALLLFYALWGAKLGAWSVGGSTNGNLNQVQDLFFRTVFTLLGYVAKRDGPVNTKEVKHTEIYMEKMSLNADQKREAIRLFKLGARPDFDADTTIKEFYGLAKKSPNLVQILLVYLISLARVDGLLGVKETDAVRKVAYGLGYSSITFKHLLQMVSSQYNFTEGSRRQKNQSSEAGKCQSHNMGADANQNQQKSSEQEKSRTNSSSIADKANQGDSESCAKKNEDFNTRDDQLGEAYKVLGVSPDIEDKELKKAYRNMANQYHPDKLVGLGLPPYMIQSATECFQAVQSAYEYIKDARAN